MKKITLLLSLLFAVAITSCSKDEIESFADEDLIGVWEQNGFLDDAGQRLVFAEDHTGIKISRKVYNEDEIVSGAILVNWEINNNTVTIFENDSNIGEYTLNSFGQLISNDLEEKPFDKISDTTLDY